MGGGGCGGAGMGEDRWGITVSCCLVLRVEDLSHFPATRRNSLKAAFQKGRGKERTEQPRANRSGPRVAIGGHRAALVNLCRGSAAFSWGQW